MRPEPTRDEQDGDARLQRIGARARQCWGESEATLGPGSAEMSAYLARRRGVVAAVRECWLEEGAVVPVLRRLIEELGPSEDAGGTAFAVVNYMSEAFCIRLSFAMKFTRWHAIGGDLSDEKTEKRFDGFITCPQYPGPGGGLSRPCETVRQSASPLT
ncbi:hypothetical protein [Streptomyces virginiae]|uniref:hypothetical protein n=2 Tax=Streptomyces virginiae TaxID=1961 RepID=UPI0036B526ED